MKRKIDGCGRVQIPAKTREKYKLENGRDLEMTESLVNGHLILTIDCGDVVEELKAILEEAGFKITEN